MCRKSFQIIIMLCSRESNLGYLPNQQYRRQRGENMTIINKRVRQRNWKLHTCTDLANSQKTFGRRQGLVKVDDITKVYFFDMERRKLLWMEKGQVGYHNPVNGQLFLFCLRRRWWHDGPRGRGEQMGERERERERQEVSGGREEA